MPLKTYKHENETLKVSAELLKSDKLNLERENEFLKSKCNKNAAQNTRRHKKPRNLLRADKGPPTERCLNTEQN